MKISWKKMNYIFLSLSVISTFFSSSSLTCEVFCCLYAFYKVRHTHQRRRLCEDMNFEFVCSITCLIGCITLLCKQLETVIEKI